MIDTLTDMAMRAVTRYGYFANILRSQLIVARTNDIRSEIARRDALSASYGAARVYLDAEHSHAHDDLLAVAASSYSDALKQMGVKDEPMSDELVSFVDDSVEFLLRALAAQAEVDVVALGKQLQNMAMRVDLYIRSGLYSQYDAIRQVGLEDKNSLSLLFTDRSGRKYKSSKHVRDAYRWALLQARNEVFIHAAVEYGATYVTIDHPDKGFKWAGERVSIVSRIDDQAPSYADIRDEVFHPSSEAMLRIA